jgi:hypothetical protein
MKSAQKTTERQGIRSLVVYKKETLLHIRVKKSEPTVHYPKVVMPEQEHRCIKGRKHECW